MNSIQTKPCWYEQRVTPIKSSVTSCEDLRSNRQHRHKCVTSYQNQHEHVATLQTICILYSTSTCHSAVASLHRLMSLKLRAIPNHRPAGLDICLFTVQKRLGNIWVYNIWTLPKTWEAMSPESPAKFHWCIGKHSKHCIRYQNVSQDARKTLFSILS